jgi:CHAT domain-containing protein
MSEIDEARGAGRSTAVLVARQVRLERVIRQRTLTSGAAGAAASQPPTLRELAAELGEAALIELVESDHTLFAVTVVAGRARLHPLGDDQMVRHCMRHLPFALHRIAGATTRPQQFEAARRVWRRAATTLFDVLLRPIAQLLAERPLVIVPAGWLQSVPWSIVDFCRGRPVSVAPSAELWMAARHRRPISDRVVVVAGKGLSGATAEAVSVGNQYPGSTVLTEKDASASRVAEAMNGARLVHIAAHANLRSDNPLFSSLLLADGPFTVYDIEQVPASPHEVIMAACSTAVSHVTAGHEILGLAAALLRQQTASLVAPVVPVPDAETAPVMAALHQRLRQHLSPAEALAATQLEFCSGTPREHASAASFICLGGR